MKRRDFLRASAWTTASMVTGVTAYTGFLEPHWTKVVRLTLPVARLPVALSGLRLVQLSDLHVGSLVSSAHLIASFEQARALNADVTVITGDFITYDPTAGNAQFERLRRVLEHVPRGRVATLGILGNHDYGLNWSESHVAARVQAEAERAGIRILRNEVATVHGLDFVGVDDLWAVRGDALYAFRQRASAAAIAICHNPDAVDRIEWRDYSGWILAGHTHGGQCKPPFLKPPLLPVENKRYTAGEINVGEGKRLYINRGLGYLIKARFNVRPEITQFTLIAA